MESEWYTQCISDIACRHTQRVIKDIVANKYGKIVFFVGAGISVAAGLPTFWSSDDETSDARSLLSKDSCSADIARALAPLIIDDAEPTDFHKLMHQKAHKIYSQNIDGLEEDDGRTVWCHGRLKDGATCKSCKKMIPWSVYKQQIPHIYFCCECGGDIRPNMVLYGEEVAFDYSEAKVIIQDADLVICAGTSLRVYPFAALLSEVKGDLLIVEPHPTKEHAQYLGGPGRHLYRDDCQIFAWQCLQPSTPKK